MSGHIGIGALMFDGGIIISKGIIPRGDKATCPIYRRTGSKFKHQEGI